MIFLPSHCWRKKFNVSRAPKYFLCWRKLFLLWRIWEVHGLTEEGITAKDAVMMPSMKVEEWIMKAITKRILTVEKVFEEIKRICWSEWEAPAVVIVWRGVSSAGVVVLILLLVVTQNFIGFSYFFKSLLGVRFLVLIRMEFQCHLSVGFFDVIFWCGFVEPEYFIVILNHLVIILQCNCTTNLVFIDFCRLVRTANSAMK